MDSHKNCKIFHSFLLPSLFHTPHIPAHTLWEQSAANNDAILCCSCFMNYSSDASSIRGLNAKIQTGKREREMKRWTEMKWDKRGEEKKRRERKKQRDNEDIRQRQGGEEQKTNRPGRSPVQGHNEEIRGDELNEVRKDTNEEVNYEKKGKKRRKQWRSKSGRTAEKGCEFAGTGKKRPIRKDSLWLGT